METKKESFAGKEYIIVELVKVKQKGKIFYLGKVPAKYLLETYTVNPTEYDFNKQSIMAAQFKGYEEYFGYLLDRVGETPDKKDSERNLDAKRVKAIKQFLEEKEYSLFPNAIIVTCDLLNSEPDMPVNLSIDELLANGEVRLPYLVDKEDGPIDAVLYIPYEKNMVLVLDGQHRIAGLKEAENIDKENDYELMIAFMLGFDRSVSAELFYTINYHQKPVNRSLLYELMGEFSRELDRTTFLHGAVKVLNEVEKSPFYLRVKMLGRIEPGTPDKVREKMTISQASLIDYLMPTISKKAIRRPMYPPIFLYYYGNKNKRIEIIKYILKYFQALSRIKNDEWDNPTSSIICNTMGIGAFTKIMYFIFIKMFKEDFKFNPDKIEGVKVADLVEKLAGIEEMSFNKERYGGASSEGGLKTLMEDIVSKIGYLGGRDYWEFERNFKQDYVVHFKNWLTENVEGLKKK